LRFNRIPVFFLSVVFGLSVGAAAQVGEAHSLITVHVGKTGLFSGLGHEHTVIAPIASGSIDGKALSVQITVPAKQMKVTDPEMAEKERAEVQSTMLGPKVLDTDKYPEIRFQSTHVQSVSPQGYRVMGTLELHGTRRELTFDVSGSGGHYHGKTKLKQTDYGILPVSGGGGTVKVKDELEIEFDIYAADLRSAPR
jgi:polyisoprenoid-binding protein YceI